MIPRAIHMIFTETEALKERGWRYQMYGQFVEIYNEKVSLASVPPGSRSFLTPDSCQINNLFGTANDQTEHKIEHDEKKGTTTVTGINPSELLNLQRSSRCTWSSH
jgi:kinesin family protein C1